MYSLNLDWVVPTALAVSLLPKVWEDTWYVRGKRQQVLGHVVDHQPTFEQGSPAFVARIAYRDIAGRLHEIDNPIVHKEKMPPAGTLISIVYPVSNPKKGRVPPSHKQFWPSVAFYLCVVALFALHVFGLAWRK